MDLDVAMDGAARDQLLGGTQVTIANASQRLNLEN